MSASTSGRRERTVVALVLIVFGALVLVACGRTWVQATIVEPGLPRIEAAVGGRSVAAVAAAAGLLAVAGGAATFLVRRWGAVAIGVLVAVVSVAGAAAAVTVLRSPSSSAAATVAETLGRTGAAPQTVNVTPWVWLAVFGSVVTAVAGVWLAVRAPRWAASDSRYSSASPDVAVGATEGGVAGKTPDGPLGQDVDALWKALDRGEDPTL